MSLGDTMFYTHQEVGDLNVEGSYIIFSDEIMEYGEKNLVVIERMNKYNDESTTLVPGFLEQSINYDNGEKISEVTPISSDQRESVARFLRRNGCAQNCFVSFFNNEIEPKRESSSHGSSHTI